jgi:hypothetical protein
MADHKQFSAEQIDFLDKFFKENPWAETAQVELIVKETGLTESIIKVRDSRHIELEKKRTICPCMSSRHIWINVEPNGIQCMHRIII